PDRVPPFPEPVARTAELPATFLGAFAEAVRTAARDGGRFALTRVQLRGKAGQVVATDGKQLLVQGGFPFPWAEDLLVPAAPAVGARELAADGPVAVGRSGDHVLVAVGPWGFALAVDRAGRFPAADGVIPAGGAAAWCPFDPREGPGLVTAVADLPGRDDPDAPVTLELADAVTI